jgi:hypothetical protein
MPSCTVSIMEFTGDKVAGLSGKRIGMVWGFVRVDPQWRNSR